MNDGGSPSLFGNVVVVRRPVTDADVAGPRRADPRLLRRPSGRSRAWCSRRGRRPDLSAHGFGRIGHPPLMFRPVGAVDDEPVAGLEVREVTDEATAVRLGAHAGRGLPRPVAAAVPGRLLPPARVARRPWRGRHWVGYLDGVAVATASAYVGPHHVDVEMISARPEVRGRGVGRAAHRGRHPRRAGPPGACSSRATTAARSTSASATSRSCGSRSGPATAADGAPGRPGRTPIDQLYWSRIVDSVTRSRVSLIDMASSRSTSLDVHQVVDRGPLQLGQPAEVVGDGRRLLGRQPVHAVEQAQALRRHLLLEVAVVALTVQRRRRARAGRAPRHRSRRDISTWVSAAVRPGGR